MYKREMTFQSDLHEFKEITMVLLNQDKHFNNTNQFEKLVHNWRM